MLVVCFKDSSAEERYQYYRFGERARPQRGEPRSLGHLAIHPGLVYVSADCAELEVINHQFKNLPEAGGPVVIYYGDTARFILGNINLKG